MKYLKIYVNLLYFSICIIGIHCIHLGLISPIEVVEEWGCHDTEIRLTCGHLDSKLAILEATFTPNCTHEDCLKLDMKRLVRVFSPHKTTADPRGAEKEAGRKFLETLRRKHPHRTEDENDDVEDDDDDTEDGGADKNSDVEILSETTEGYYSERYPNGPSADPLISQKKKNPSLRTTLERLIIRYLRRLSPDDDFSMNNRRDRMRYRRDLGSGDEPNDTSAEVDDESDTFDEKIKINDNSFSGSGSVNDVNSGFGENEMSSAEELHRIQESRSYCIEQKREITSLSKFDLERSFLNESDEDYNIRRVLNKRCSGKNHCSFIFAIDHPFSKVWESGIVRVKYICMEDFRVNRYCGEHLTIDYEVDPKIQVAEANKRGPVASARKQTRDTTAFHSVKILRTGDSEESERGRGSISNDSRKRKIKVQSSKLQESPKSKEQGSRVYSQDFRKLKILPSNIDDFNDIAKIGDEIYFRKDGDVLNEDDRSTLLPPKPPATQGRPFEPIPTYPTLEDITSEEDLKFFVFPTVVMPSVPSDYATDSLHATITDAKESNEDLDGGFIPPPLFNPYPTPPPKKFRKFPNITTLTIREGEQIIIRFPLNRTMETSSSITTNATATATTATSYATATDTTVSTATPLNAWILDNIIMPVNASDNRHAVTVTETAKDRSQQQLNAFSTSTSTIEYKPDQERKPEIEEIIINEIEINSTLPSIHGGELIVESISNKNLKDFEDNDLEEDVEETSDDKDDDGDEDDDTDEDDDYNFEMRHRTKIYNSIQRTSFRAPLMHGFAMTPGYPKFYIGDSECKWVIIAPGGLKIRFTIMDISLRSDENECKDYIHILDLKMNRTLFNSCSEAIRPLEVISDSNRVEVIVKTTTKFAYPKRGVLLHYSALGCVIPPAPKNGRLIERTETAALYECNPSFVFPDTGDNRRQLACTDREFWDKVVPDCIEQEYIVQRDGFITDIEIILNKKPPDVYHHPKSKNATKMPSQDADTVFDIVIPSLIMAALFIINGVVFTVIMKYRKRQKTLGNSIQLNEL